MTIKLIFVHIAFAAFVAFIFQKLLHDEISFMFKNSEETLPRKRVSSTNTTSVWCNGDNHIDRRCRFVNLCYKKDTNDFLFLHDDQESIISQIPDDRFNPSLLDISSEFVK